MTNPTGPYDQVSLEAGMNFGIVIGISISVTAVSAIYLTTEAVRWFKEQKNPKK